MYLDKYLKYKTKYINLKMRGGATNPVPFKYRDCKCCKLPIGITSYKDTGDTTNIKLFPGSNCVVLRKDDAFHLKTGCKPDNPSAKLDIVYGVIGDLKISPKIQVDREVEITKCNVCLGNFEDDPGLEMVILPCQHMTCASCLVSIFNTNALCPICKVPLIPDVSGETINQVIAERSATAEAAFESDMGEELQPMAEREPSVHGFLRAMTADPAGADEDYEVPDFAREAMVQSTTPFELNKKYFYNNPVVTRPSDATIAQVEPNTIINSKSPVLLSCITEQTNDYNDLVVCIYSEGELRGTVNYSDMHFSNDYIDITHSGDELRVMPGAHGSYNHLLHNTIIKGKREGLRFEIKSLDIPCTNPTNVTSVNQSAIKREADKIIATLVSGTPDQVPINIILFSQAIFQQTSGTLAALSPNVAPSSVFLTTNANNTKVANGCAWTHDNVPMTFWGALFVYEE